MKISDFYKTIIVGILQIPIDVSTNWIEDKYISTLIIIVSSIVFLGITLYEISEAIKKQKTIDRFIDLKNKYGTELDGLEAPNYLGYISTHFRKEEIEFLFNVGEINKSNYETYQNHLKLL